MLRRPVESAQRFTAEFVEATRPAWHAPGDRWFADETHLTIAGQWAHLYRAIDQHGQVIDVLLSERHDLTAPIEGREDRDAGWGDARQRRGSERCTVRTIVQSHILGGAPHADLGRTQIKMAS